MKAARRDAALALGIALLAALPYLLAGVGESFSQLDDPVYVTANRRVLQGLTAAGARWALTTLHFGNWIPLTLFSHMLDVSFFGLDARGHHATSLLLHAVNAGLLFVALRRLTGFTGRSAFAAALFGVHPLHVESVAWIAERKDVLSGLFFLLVLLAWERYARRGGGWRYGAALGLFALGLTAKPMLVTVPFVLLLLDVWPLGRTPLVRAQEECHAVPGWRALLLEKVPFLALAAASSAATVLAQRTAGALADTAHTPLGARLANAAVSYAAYLGTTLWPARLAVYYPYSTSVPWPAAAASALLLAVLSFAAFRRWPVQPYLAVGWCWFVGMLVPVIGLVHIGGHARADRFTYLPLIGLFVGVAWLAAERLPAALRRPRVLGTLAGGIAAAYAAAAAVQAGYWRDSETLLRRTLAVTQDNWFAHDNLAAVLINRGQYEEALRHSLEAVRLYPQLADARYNLGTSLAALGRHEEAVAQYREALQLAPAYADASNNLALSLAALGRYEEALARYREALRLDPTRAYPYNNLGALLAALGRHEEAVAQYREAIRLDPAYAYAYVNLGNSLAALRRHEEAVAQYREAVRLAPGYAEAYENLGLSLAALGRSGEAAQAFGEAARLSRGVGAP